ncbi:hypothetical protein D3C86_2187590 [compost metagenome]
MLSPNLVWNEARVAQLFSGARSSPVTESCSQPSLWLKMPLKRNAESSLTATLAMPSK